MYLPKAYLGTYIDYTTLYIIFKYITFLFYTLFTFFQFPIDCSAIICYNISVSNETVGGFMTLFEAFPDIFKNPLFKNTDQKLLTEFFDEGSFEVRVFESQQIIRSPKNESDSVGFIISGVATVSADSGNERFTLRSLSVGDTFGISNLYSEDSPFPSVVSAKGQVTCLLINRQAFKSYLEGVPEALHSYLKMLNEKIVYLNRKITVFTAGSVEKKLAVFLFENRHDGVAELPCSMSALAEMLGVGRASLYRAFDKLTELGLIERKDKQIILLSCNELKSFFS